MPTCTASTGTAPSNAQRFEIGPVSGWQWFKSTITIVTDVYQFLVGVHRETHGSSKSSVKQAIFSTVGDMTVTSQWYATYRYNTVLLVPDYLQYIISTDRSGVALPKK